MTELIISPIEFFFGFALLLGIWVCINLNSWLDTREQSDELFMAQERCRRFKDGRPYPNTYKELLEYKKRGFIY